ncbi:ribonuclease III [Oligoflexia bacterium]|nr:ribonuclease III [Oligoflexia bacterium]
MRFGIFKSSSSDDDGDDQARIFGKDQYPELAKTLGFTFKDYDCLERALTHRSAHFGDNQSDYERLEFLGDAVLDLAVADLLLKRHPEAKEGELSKMRAALVNTTSLAGIAQKLNLGSFIILSRGELANGGAERPSILADVLEAVIGAIFRAGGYEGAYRCIENFFGDELINVTPSDPKTELQEALHAVGGGAPVYLLECVEGPEHAPTFVSVVEVEHNIVGRGRGPTKKASQQIAANEAMTLLASAEGCEAFSLKEKK